MQVNLQLPENDDKKYRQHTNNHTRTHTHAQCTTGQDFWLLAAGSLTRVISHRPEVKST